MVLRVNRLITRLVHHKVIFAPQIRGIPKEFKRHATTTTTIQEKIARVVSSNPVLLQKLAELNSMMASKKIIDPANPPRMENSMERMKMMMTVMQDKELREKLMQVGPLMQDALRQAGVDVNDLMKQGDSDLMNMMLSPPVKQEVGAEQKKPEKQEEGFFSKLFKK